MKWYEFVLIVLLIAIGIAINQPDDARRPDEWGTGELSPDSDPSEKSWRWDLPAP